MYQDGSIEISFHLFHLTGLPFDPYELVDIAVANVISILIFGKRFEYDDTLLKTLLDVMHQSSEMAVGPWALLYNAMPLVRRLPLPHQRILTTMKKIDDFIEKEVEEHKATLVLGEPRDLTDAYLEEIQKAERKGSSFEEEQLRISVSELFVAGTETTAGTLRWGFLYLMAFPEIQEECWKEINAVLGNNASLKYEDREHLPYTNAVIHEIQRISNVAALGIPHAPIKDVQLFGYTIPKVTGRQNGEEQSAQRVYEIAPPGMRIWGHYRTGEMFWVGDKEALGFSGPPALLFASHPNKQGQVKKQTP
ncbi:cytochrome P450 2J2-like [Python bivittatus]|uniref:Cytochrome P450 2J2-like n=1 Tax=Python bivittatus TaxID=176946 RepID=A0A9F5N7J9_PYTBI|nr:cytochrome P450 2J2-like [Python bivittatus]